MAKTVKPLAKKNTTKGGHNVCIRVDGDSAARLISIMQEEGFASRSQFVGWILEQFLTDLKGPDPMSVPDMLYFGRQRAQNPEESIAQWQCHDERIVNKIKMLEEALDISRTVIGRAAIARFLARRTVTR